MRVLPHRDRHALADKASVVACHTGSGARLIAADPIGAVAALALSANHTDAPIGQAAAAATAIDFAMIAGMIAGFVLISRLMIDAIGVDLMRIRAARFGASGFGIRDGGMMISIDASALRSGDATAGTADDEDPDD